MNKRFDLLYKLLLKRNINIDLFIELLKYISK